MLELKKKYNELLSRYNKGLSMMEEVKDNKEKENEYLNLLKDIQLEMNDTLMKIEEFSDEETVNGFILEVIEDATPVETTVVEENVSQATAPVVAPVIHNQPNVINTIDSYQSNWEMAVNLSKSDLVPDNYKKKPENVIIALGMSQQTGLPPFTIMQNLNIVRGKASFSGSFCKILIERTGRFKDLELNYIGEKGKDTYGCYLSATRVSDNKIIKGPEVTMAMAKSEGWTTNKKWITLTDLMLAYRCQSFFARLYCPEALNGVYTSEEMEDIKEGPRQIQDVL